MSTILIPRKEVAPHELPAWPKFWITGPVRVPAPFIIITNNALFSSGGQGLAPILGTIASPVMIGDASSHGALIDVEPIGKTEILTPYPLVPLSSGGGDVDVSWSASGTVGVLDIAPAADSTAGAACLGPVLAGASTSAMLTMAAFQGRSANNPAFLPRFSGLPQPPAIDDLTSAVITSYDESNFRYLSLPLSEWPVWHVNASGENYYGGLTPPFRLASTANTTLSGPVAWVPQPSPYFAYASALPTPTSLDIPEAIWKNPMNMLVFQSDRLRVAVPFHSIPRSPTLPFRGVFFDPPRNFGNYTVRLFLSTWDVAESDPLAAGAVLLLASNDNAPLGAISLATNSQSSRL